MNTKNIGKNVKQIRKSCNLTQEKLAEAVDISTVHMSHIETGSVAMSLDCLLQICKVLNTTPNDILLGEFECSRTDFLGTKVSLTADELLFLNRIVDLINDIKINR